MSDDDKAFIASQVWILEFYDGEDRLKIRKQNVLQKKENIFP